VPYNYQTPQGQEIDLQLFNNDLMKKSHNLLKEILEREAKGWYVQYKEQILQDLRGNAMIILIFEKNKDKSLVNTPLSNLVDWLVEPEYCRVRYVLLTSIRKPVICMLIWCLLLMMVIFKFPGKNLSQDDISTQVNNAIMEEYLRRVYSAILSSEDVENLSPGLGKSCYFMM
jgi:hypothetical protein